MISLYTSAYNLVSMGFDYKTVFANWLQFLHGQGQLVIAVNTSTDDTVAKVKDWMEKWQQEHGAGTKVDVIEIAIPYDDPLFDGKIKAAALAACTESFAMLLDCDEVLIPRHYRRWVMLCRDLEQSPYEAFLIPVVDLIGDERFYKSIQSKWYLHRNLPHLTRGVVKAARLEDGSINTSLSDSTELINRETGELARAASLLSPGLPDYIIMGQLENDDTPYVTHLGWLNLEQRLKQSAFWRPIWTARRGGRDPEKAMTLEDLEAIPRFRHRLASWKEAV